MSIHHDFGRLLVKRGAELAEKYHLNDGTWVCQDYSMFLAYEGNGTVKPDRFGWMFYSESDMRNLASIARDKGFALPEALNAECYVAFAEKNDGERYFLFRTQRPKATTPLIYQGIGARVVEYASGFEDFVEKLRYEFENKANKAEMATPRKPSD